MLITVMSEGELHVPRLGPARGVAGLPSGGGDEPVRRDRYGPHLGRGLRPGVPAGRRLPVGDATRATSPAGRRGPTTSIRPGSTRSSSSCGSPVPIPTCVSDRRCAARSTCAPSHRRSPWCVAQPVRSRERVARCRARRPVRAGCGSARATSRTADDIVRELWGSVFAAVHDGAGEAREKLAPRLGPRPPAEVPAADTKEGDEADEEVDESAGSGPRRVATSPATTLRRDLARGRQDRRGRRCRRGAGRRPRRELGVAGRSHRRDRREAARAGAAPGGPAVPRHRPTRPGDSRAASDGCARSGTGPTVATSMSTPASTRWSRPRCGRRGRRSGGPAGPGVDEAGHGDLPARRSQRLDGRQAARHRRRSPRRPWRGERPTTTRCCRSART